MLNNSLISIDSLSFQVAVSEVGDVAERGICVRGSEKRPTNAWPSKATGSSAQQVAGRRGVNVMAHSSKRNGNTRLVFLHTWRKLELVILYEDISYPYSEDVRLSYIWV